MDKTKQIPVIGISGPSGAGKDYLTQVVIERLGVANPQMVTTRPHRGEGVETKICIADVDYNKHLESGELVGHHENKGFHYAYRIGDIQALAANGATGAIIELNPVYQAAVPQELADRPEAKDVSLVRWFVLEADPEYLTHNMTARQEMAAEELAKRLDMARMIMEAGQQLAGRDEVVMFKVGWHNRETMADEFAKLVAESLGSNA